MTPLAMLLLLTAAPARVELILGGDVIPHTPVRGVAAVHTLWDGGKPRKTTNHLGWDHVFAPLASTFDAVDFAVVNLETPISGNPNSVTAEMLFDAPSEMLDGMVSARVKIATFANNHGVDQFREGIIATRKALTAAGLLSAGADVDEEKAWRALVVEKNGLKVGIFAFTRYLNDFNNLRDPKQPHVPMAPYSDDPLSRGYSEAQLLEKVRAAAKECEALVVIPHWGDEYRPLPRPDDQQLAWRLVEAGAIAVVGHHPHVLEPVQTVVRPGGSEALIAYSLGNLVSNQDMSKPESPRRDGLLMKFAIERVADGGTELRDIEPVPVWTENVYEKGKPRNIQPRVIDVHLAELRERIALLEGLEDQVVQLELKELARQVALFEVRKERILRVVPLELQLPRSP